MSMPTIDLPEIDFQDALSNILGSIALGEAGLAHILNTEGMKIQNVIAINNVTIDDLYAVNDSITSIVQGAANIEAAMHVKLNAVISHITPPPAAPGILEQAPATVAADMLFYGGPINRASVESVTFVQGTVVPPTALGSWDASAAQDGSVIAWYEQGTSLGLYNVYFSSEGGVRGNPDSRNMFAECINLKTIDFTHFDTVGVTNMDNMFYNASQLVSVDVSGFDTQQVTDMAGMFYGTAALSTVDLSNFNTSQVTTMAGMFQGSGVSALNFSSFDTSNVTTMARMFYLANHLTSLDLGTFNTEKVTDMSFMFSDTTSLNTLIINSFDTSQVTTMAGMFQRTALTSLDLGFFNTENLLSMDHMFYQSSQLAMIDVSNFDVTHVTNMNMAFQGTSSLLTLDLRHWSTPTASHINIFQGTNGSIRIYVNSAFDQNFFIGTELPPDHQIIVVP